MLEQKSLAHLEIDWEIKYWELAGHLDKFSSFLNFAFSSFSILFIMIKHI